MKSIHSVAGLILGLLVAPASATVQFTTAASGVVGNLSAVAYDGKSKFLVVGTNSTVTVGSFAEDHIQWIANAGPGPVSLLSVTYGNGLFLAGAVGGTAFTSTDGIQWGTAAHPFGNAASVSGVSFNPRASGYPNFVAVASIFEIAYSNSATPTSWLWAHLSGGSYLESFLGVTPFSTNGFAVCGAMGVIRLSSDGGANWVVCTPFNLGSTNLYGIASDGTNQLVTVGAGGAVWFSANGGTTWAKQNPVGTDLNAVAYDRSESCWVAVGNQSVVLTSANGISWNRQIGLSGNFHGIAFADTGLLQGVGVLVGDAGNIVLVGSAPPVPTSLGDVIYCGGTELQPMQVTSNSTPSNPLVTADWYAVATGGTPVATNCFCFYPPDTYPPPGSALTNVYYAEARDLRTGFVSSTRVKVMLIVNPRPDAGVMPSAQTAETGSTVRFQAGAAHPGAGLGYQWFFAGTNILASATAAVLELTDLQPAQAGVYSAVITNRCVAVTSAPAFLSLIPPVERRVVPALRLRGDTGSLLHVEYSDSLNPPHWFTMADVNLEENPELTFDLSQPVRVQRFYRAWQTNGSLPPLQAGMATAIILTGDIGESVRVDYINAIGPTDAWWTLDTVTLTNTSQLYFDTSSIGQPRRLYRLVPVP